MRSFPRPSASALRTLVLVGSLLTWAVGCGGSGSGSGPGSGTPTAPSSNTVPGPWVGTLARPDGLAPIAVRWQVGSDFSGPMTLTNGSSSVTFQLASIPSGPKGTVTSLHFNFSVNTGAIATLPNCSILSKDSVDATNLQEPITTITTAPFGLSYTNCQGFVDPTPTFNFRAESTQLTMTKQP